MNLFYRMAAKFDVVAIARELCEVRYHIGQTSQADYNGSRAIGPAAVLAERIDAAAHLLQSRRSEEAGYRAWLAERLFDLNRRHSHEWSRIVPGLTYSWTERVSMAREELDTLVAGDRFVLIDGNEWDLESSRTGPAVPFLEHEGRYWGPPADSATGIEEIERQRLAGMGFAVFGWPAFWWLDYYADMRRYLRATYPIALNNSRLVAFDLRNHL